MTGITTKTCFTSSVRWVEALHSLYRILALSVLAGLSIVESASAVEDEIRYSFAGSGGETELRAQFIVPGSPQCVLRTVFEFSHMQAYADTLVRLELVYQTEGENLVDYLYTGFGIKSRLRYRRLYQPREQSIRVELVSAETQGFLAPKILQSSGRFLAKAAEEGTELSYQEHVQFSSSLLNFAHIHFAQNKSLEYLINLKHYLIGKCSPHSVENGTPRGGDNIISAPMIKQGVSVSRP